MRANMAEMARTISGAEPELVEAFLYSLFTPAEADEMAKRWALVRELSEGTPQRRVAEDLGLSLCKITRGSRELKKDHSAFRAMLARATGATRAAGASGTGADAAGLTEPGPK